MGEKYYEICAYSKDCVKCGRKIENGELMFNHASYSFNSNMHFRGMCVDCQIEVIFMATGKKYLRPKVVKNIQEMIVAKKV